MDWRGFGVEGLASSYQKITPEEIQMQLDRDEIEMGTGERDGGL